MKKHKAGVLAAAVALGLSASPAMAAIDLFDWAFYVDGVTYENSNGDSMPTTGTLTGLNDPDVSDFGTLTWTTNLAGAHTFLAFFDYEIDEADNTFFNESGAAVNEGDAAVGQSWEIDEPFAFGDIYDHVLAGTLDNSNYWDTAGSTPDDVSFAMGWDFTLDAGQTATIKLVLSDIMPQGGFYLSQTDSDSAESIYFSSTLAIGGGTDPVPEPATMLLMGTGLAGLLGVGRKKMKKA